MELSETVVKLTVFALNLLFWLVVAVRIAVSQRRSRSSDNTTRAVRPTVATSLAWPRTRNLIISVVLGGVVYYALLVLWWIDPRLAGPRLLLPSALIMLSGIGLAVVGIALMAWAYIVLDSFRVLPQVDEDHKLCTRGPYARMRHPVYLGIDLFFFGSFLILPHLGFFLQFVANAITHEFRARAEEEVLTRSFGDAYRRYMQRTYRRIPRIFPPTP